MGLILDSSVVIAAERRSNTVEQLLEQVVSISDDQDAALSAVGATALSLGFSLLTVNLRRFQLIPGLKIVAF
jgi:predicted nucleic acid-binding protein